MIRGVKSSEQIAKEDLEWWMQFCPQGWRIHGWTYRLTCVFVNPKTDNYITVDGEYVSALLNKSR